MSFADNPYESPTIVNDAKVPEPAWVYRLIAALIYAANPALMYWHVIAERGGAVSEGLMAAMAVTFFQMFGLFAAVAWAIGRRGK